MSFTGAVLTGGRSTRMGRDKALLEVGGRPLAGIGRDALVGAGARRVLAVGGDAVALSGLGFEVIGDGWPGEGPLGAVVTALDAAADDAVVVLACDLPFVEPATVEAVLQAVLDGDADAAVPVNEGRLEVVVAAYRRRCGAVLRAAFERGERALWRAVANLTVSPVMLAEPRWLTNANAPSDVAGAEL